MGIASKTTEVKYLQKGPQGNKGAKLRMLDWRDGEEYLSGRNNELFYDIVLYQSKLYLCLVSHISVVGVNDPLTSVSQQKGFWGIAQDWTFIATKLLLAEKINASQIDADGLVAKDVKITGEINATSGVFENVVIKGKIGGFRITDTSLIYDYSDSGEQPSIIINASGTDHFRINESVSSPFLDIRADRRKAISVFSYGSYSDMPSCISVTCNGGGYGKAIESYGNVSLIARDKENITINGLALNVRTVNSSGSILSSDDVIISVANIDITLNLPRSGHIWKIIWIRKAGLGNVNVNGNGLKIKANGAFGDGGFIDSFQIVNGQLYMLFCTGGAWFANNIT